jgi:hypothetical protein
MQNLWFKLLRIPAITFALQKCNNQETNTQKTPPKKPPTSATSVADSTKLNPDTWQTLIKEQGLIESDELDPAAFLFIKNPDNSFQYCVGNYIGNRKILTAAHCLQGITDPTNCKKDILIEWTSKNETINGDVPLSKKYIGCKAFQLHPKSNSPTDKVDVALLLLDTRGFLPKRKFELDHLENFEPETANIIGSSKNLVGIGKSYGDGDNLKFKKVSGRIYELTGTHFATQIYNEKGMSGSAVEYLSNESAGRKIMVGIHFAGKQNTFFSLSVKTSAFLSWVNTARLE